jgi:hypothetical protein
MKDKIAIEDVAYTIEHNQIISFCAKTGTDLTNDAKGWQNHDVNLGVAKEPENMLEHYWVATTGTAEKKEVPK